VESGLFSLEAQKCEVYRTRISKVGNSLVNVSNLRKGRSVFHMKDCSLAHDRERNGIVLRTRSAPKCDVRVTVESCLIEDCNTGIYFFPDVDVSDLKFSPCAHGALCPGLVGRAKEEILGFFFEKKIRSVYEIIDNKIPNPRMQ
jgi:hypothetical protein